ncbi:transposase [Methylobacterium mesophilicum]|uniref:transposase n=1 Tax=Methylobacterium mesophilicum TaxID=39956 RepID=UPI0034D70256
MGKHEVRLAGSPAVKPARRRLPGLLGTCGVGRAWRMLPAGFLPRRTVSGRFRRWIERRLFEVLMQASAHRQPRDR